MSMFDIKGGFTGIAVSSRVRLARNIKGYPFRLDGNSRKEIAEKVLSALRSNPTVGPEFELTQVLPRSAAAARLMEERLISPELAQDGGWIIVSKDKGVSVMVGEEDHIRLQAIGKGLCPKECLETAERIASLIGNELLFAYDERLGYLTACPTNVGTGLRASVMLHLPMLAETGNIQQLTGYAGSRGCAVRGAYGEGTKPVGGFYQISNQVTLGASAAELTEKLVETTASIIDAEKNVREQVRSRNGDALQDRVCRSAGAMKSAHLMDTDEAIKRISDVLVGLQLGYLSGIEPESLYELEKAIRPAMLEGNAGERDLKRAGLIREASKPIQIS